MSTDVDFAWIVPERLAVGAAGFPMQFLADNRIDAVICVAPLDEVPVMHPMHMHPMHPNPNIHRFPVSFSQPDRTSAANMRAAAEACLVYIASGKTVYLHCVAGFNRSAAVAVLAVQELFRISRTEACEYVAARRRVDPARHLALFDGQVGRKADRRDRTRAPPS